MLTAARGPGFLRCPPQPSHRWPQIRCDSVVNPPSGAAPREGALRTLERNDSCLRACRLFCVKHQRRVGDTMSQRCRHMMPPSAYHPLHRLRVEELRDRSALAALLPSGSVGCELGVWRGDHAADLLEHVSPRKLHLVDNWSWPKGLDPRAESERIRVRFRSEIAAGRVVFHESTFADFLASIPDRSIDWIYVDGAHSYAEVARDLWQAWPKVRIGGILCGHDFAIRPAVWGTGVCRAVLELVQNRAGTLIALSNENLGDWAMRVEDPRDAASVVRADTIDRPRA